MPGDYWGHGDHAQPGSSGGTTPLRTVHSHPIDLMDEDLLDTSPPGHRSHGLNLYSSVPPTHPQHIPNTMPSIFALLSAVSTSERLLCLDTPPPL